MRDVTSLSTTQSIDAYVGVLAGALRGPRRLRDDLVTEARDSLVDATEAYEARGLCRTEAEREAVADFGPVREIAAAYRPELALAQARRAAVLLSALIIIQPVVWAEGRWPWIEDPAVPPSNPVFGVLDRAVSVIGTLTMIGAVLAVVACGVGTRWAGTRQLAAGATAVFSLAAGLLLPLLAIGMGLTANSSVVTVLSSLAWGGMFVVLPSVFVAVSARRALTIITA